MLMYDMNDAGGSIHIGFHRVSPNIRIIHDEFIEIRQKTQYYDRPETKFEYSPYQKGAEVDIDGLVFKLPKTVGELDIWAQQLQNCMFGYANNIISHETVIYGVKKKGR